MAFRYSYSECDYILPKHSNQYAPLILQGEVIVDCLTEVFEIFESLDSSVASNLQHESAVCIHKNSPEYLQGLFSLPPPLLSPHAECPEYTCKWPLQEGQEASFGVR